MIINLYETEPNLVCPFVIILRKNFDYVNTYWICDNFYQARIASRKLTNHGFDVSITIRDYRIDYFLHQELFDDGNKSGLTRFKKCWFWDYPSVEIKFNDYTSLRNQKARFSCLSLDKNY
jgi:hypothetical protein